MRSFKQLANQTIGRAVLAEDIVEFHAARLLLLIDSAKGKRIRGLTKLAKLDFFVRYPDFFNEASRHSGGLLRSLKEDSESAMIRFRYGPWDPRYYQIIPFLEGRGLVRVDESGRAISFTATKRGVQFAKTLRGQEDYTQLIGQIEVVTKTFGRKSGNQLKELIYGVFQAEVGDRRMGERIE